MYQRLWVLACKICGIGNFKLYDKNILFHPLNRGSNCCHVHLPHPSTISSSYGLNGVPTKKQKKNICYASYASPSGLPWRDIRRNGRPVVLCPPRRPPSECPMRVLSAVLTVVVGGCAVLYGAHTGLWRRHVPPPASGSLWVNTSNRSPYEMNCWKITFWCEILFTSVVASFRSSICLPWLADCALCPLLKCKDAIFFQSLCMNSIYFEINMFKAKKNVFCVFLKI